MPQAMKTASAILPMSKPRGRTFSINTSAVMTKRQYNDSSLG